MYAPRAIGVVLLLLGLLRAVVVVTHEPMLGYANQHDMFRTSACIGLYPDIPTQVRANPLAPLPLYRRDAPSPKDCYPSTEVALGAAVLAATGAMQLDSEPIRLQWIGYAKLVWLFAAVILVAWTLRDHGVASLIHGAIVLIILSDPVVTLWFNSLYTEFFVFWGLYATMGAACALAITRRGSMAMWILLVIGLAALAFSREQFALLPPALVALSWPWLWSRSRIMTLAAFGVALVVSFISFSIIVRPQDVHWVNRIDTYLGLVTNASTDPVRTLATLGLPERCASMVGASYYQQRGQNVEEVCPEVFKLSSVAFLRLASTEPDTLARSMARALPAMQSVSIGYLGTKAGDEPVSFHWLPWWASSPLDTATSRLSSVMFATLVLAACLVAPLALLGAFVQKQHPRTEGAAWLLFAILLSGTIAYVLVTTVFGDGLSEAARHFLPGSLVMYSLMIAAVIGSLCPIPAGRSIDPRHIGTATFGVIVAAGIIALICVMALIWAKMQPLAIGAVEPPAGREASSAGLQISGWALDPFGVDAIEVHLGKLSKNARYGEMRPDVLWSYPGYPDARGAWFKLDLTTDDLARAGAPGDLPLRVLVNGRGGAVTEIDRRTIVIGP